MRARSDFEKRHLPFDLGKCLFSIPKYILENSSLRTSRSGLKSELRMKLRCLRKSENSVSLKRSEHEFPSVQSSCEKSDEDGNSPSNFGHLVVA